MASDDRSKGWIVTENGDDCGHPADAVDHVAADGLNSYYQCTECESVLITSIGN